MENTLEGILYNVNKTCPVCGNKTVVTKIKYNKLRVSSRESDFSINYEGVNPLLYEAWVCEECGYAAFSDKFDSIGDKEISTIKNNITPKWRKRSFTGERTIDNAIEAYKLILLNLEVRGARDSDMARVCMRLAWLYRMKEDKCEFDFLAHALKFYSNAFETERFPVDKLDEFTCMYLIGELNRRIGNTEEAIKWFSKVIASPDARKKPVVIESAREQFQLLRSQQTEA